MGTLKDNIHPPIEAEKINFLKRIVKMFDENNVDYWLEFGTLLGCVRDHSFIPWDSDIDIGVFNIEDVKRIKDKLEQENLEVTEKDYCTLVPTLEIRDKSLLKESYFHADIFQFLRGTDGYEYRWLIRRNLICRTSNYIAYIFRQEPVVNAGQYQIKLTNLLIDFTRAIPKRMLRIIHNIFYNIDFAFSIDRTLLFNDFKTVKVKFYDMEVRIPDNAEEHLLVNYGKNWRTPMKVSQHGGDEFVRVITHDGRQICYISEAKA